MILAVLILCAQVEATGDIANLDFLLGDWQTESTYPDGTQAKGELSYEAVLGGQWIKFIFVGKHPTRSIWEAHGMIRSIAGGFETYAFFGEDAPLLLKGSMIDQDTVRFVIESPTGNSGIDYSATEDGVYQENWRMEAGLRVVTLRTDYRRKS